MCRTIIAIALLFILPGCLYAQGRVTKDPNLVEDKLETELKADSRLAQKVTYEARRKAVVDILADLSKGTGITFYAGYNNNDWQVRDRKMNIFAKDTTLADLMSSIARVMKFKWSLSDEADKTTYRLYMDRKTLLDAESQAYRQEEKIEKELAKKREQVLGNLCSAGNLSQEDLQKLKAEDPISYVFAVSGVSTPLGQFFREVPSALDALSSSQEMTIGGSSVSPVAQQALKQYMEALSKLGSKLNGGKTTDLPDDMSTVAIQINPYMDELKSSMTGDMILGGLSATYDNTGMGFPLLNPDSPLARLVGRALIQNIETDKPFKDIMKDMQDEFASTAMQQIKQDDSGEPVTEHADDPALEVKIKPKPKDQRLTDIESALAESSEFSVVSDSFDIFGVPSQFDDKEVVLKDALEKIADGFHYNWDRSSAIIEFRDRDWFRKRNAQIPQAWIDAWKKTLKDTGTLDIGDLAQIAMLTQEQLNVNIRSDEDLRRCDITRAISPNTDLFRAYASLDDTQRAAIFADSGLDFRTLTSDQWKPFSKLISRRNISYLQNADAQLILGGKKTAKDGLFTYDFSLTSSDGQPPIKWSFTTPKYVELPKEENKTNQAK